MNARKIIFDPAHGVGGGAPQGHPPVRPYRISEEKNEFSDVIKDDTDDKQL